ncbi:hypothetical protein RYZ26_18620 [Terasakiella sp. A23]|uniref:capsular polysaccharide export protein, LipB/KpsS family n=1 Tax=Terasakiella sp. FCG-A23 TaxID=3080561 RepID=UPI00295575BF|nr:hypothetical protein [Terasakiella sp. A23]MDV7341621.1 hypothetical protein [Terasakiella sp. A23]
MCKLGDYFQDTTVYISVDVYERYLFFKRFAATALDLTKKIVMLTSRQSIYRKARKDGFACHLIKVNDSHSNEGWMDHSVAKSWNVLNGTLSPQTALKTFSSSFHFFDRLISLDQGASLLVLWNGNAVVEKALSSVADNNGIPKVFLEIGNITGKIFADPYGVNAQAKIATILDDLDTLECNFSAFEKWCKTYLKDKLKAHNVPQANIIRNANKFWFIDRFSDLFLDSVWVDETSFIDKVKNVVQRKSSLLAGYKCDRLENLPKHYIFQPLQVTSDTNILINSDVDNQQVLSKAMERAKAKGWSLVLKVHPAETDAEFVRTVFSLRDGKNVFVCNDNTFQLIYGAEEVYNINSTVGIEAMLACKPVRICGRTFYNNFDRVRLAKYIQHYLVDCDYFLEKTVSKEAVYKILSRAEVREARRASE